MRSLTPIMLADAAASKLPFAVLRGLEKLYAPISFARHGAALRRSQYDPIDIKKERQLEQLRRMIVYAGTHVPYYRNLFQERKIRPEQINSLSDIDSIPLLTKADVQNNKDLLISDEYSKESLIRKNTSGTTGTPLEVYFSPQELHMCGAYVETQYSMAGVSLRASHIVITKAFMKGRWHKDKNVLYVNTIQFDAAAVHELAMLLKENKQYSFIRGYPSYVYKLAQYLLANNIAPQGITAVITGAEYLSDYQRDSIQQVFGCGVFNFFGMNESLVFGFECDQHAGFHMDMTNSYNEFIPVQNAPGMYRVVATGLLNKAMPFIRYETGDLVELSSDAQCACGRTDPLIRNICGRQVDLVQLADGSVYNFHVLAHCLRGTEGVKESRFVYMQNRKIILEIVPSFFPLNVQQIRKRLSQLFSGKVEWEISFVDAVPRLPNGKVRFVEVVR